MAPDLIGVGLDGSEMITAPRLRRPSTSPASIALGASVHGRDEEPIGEAAMRTERPEPWGFDLWDPRLTMRQQAGDAQRLSDAEGQETDDPADWDDPASAEPRELEPVGGVGR
jgi:hypothetical protein